MKNISIHEADFREALSRTAATVSVVSTDGPAGLTVSAMCSVSTKPPSLFVCVNEESGVCKIIRDNSVMCINILRSNQGYISDTFSGRLEDSAQDPFEIANWDTASTGAPVMSEALINLDCSITNEIHHATHYIFIGEIEKLKLNQSDTPLIYRDRMYEQLGVASSLSLEDIEYSWERHA